MTDLEIIQTLRACSAAKGKRCNECPRFGKGLYSPQCIQGAMSAAASAIERLTNELKWARAERDVVTKRMIDSAIEQAASNAP